MAANSDIRYKQVLDNSQFKKGLKDSQGATSQFSSVISKIGPMIAGAFAVGAIANFFSTSLKGMFDEEKASAQLLNSLKGRRELTDTLIKQAKELSQITLFEDDAIISAQSILAVFVKQKDQLTALTPLVADFATKFGMDLGDAAKLVGKSVAGSAVAMKKLGIEVTGTAGSTERYNSVLDALIEKVGGAAVDAANTNAGAVQNLGKQWGELGESLLRLTGPVLSTIAKGLTELTNSIAKTFDDTALTKWERFQVIVDGLLGLDKWANQIMALADARQAVADAAAKEAEVGPSRSGFEDFVGQIEEINAVNKEAADGADEAAKAFGKEQKAIRDKDKAFAQSIGKQMKPVTTSDLMNSGALTDMQQKMLGFYEAVANNRITGMQLPVEEFKGLDLAIRTTADGLTGFTEKYATFSEGIVNISEIMGDAVKGLIMNMSEVVAQAFEAMVSGGDVLGGLMDMIASFLKMLGQSLIAAGIAGIAFKKLLATPWLAIAAGIALVALSGVVAGVMKRGADGQGMAQGGIVPSGFPGDTYPARLTSGEMVIPPNKLPSMMNQMQPIVMETILRGQDIWLVQKKINTKMSNYR